jgi:hypothetical protein
MANRSLPEVAQSRSRKSPSASSKRSRLNSAGNRRRKRTGSIVCKCPFRRKSGGRKREVRTGILQESGARIQEFVFGTGNLLERVRKSVPGTDTSSNGRAKPKFVPFAIQKATDIEFVAGLDRIGNRNAPRTECFFRRRRVIRGNCDSRIWRLSRRSIPVRFEHQDCLTQEVTDLL